MDRIADQVERDLAQRTGVGDDRRQRMRQRGADDDAFAVGLRLQHGDATLDQLVEVLIGKEKSGLPVPIRERASRSLMEEINPSPEARVAFMYSAKRSL